MHDLLEKVQIMYYVHYNVTQYQCYVDLESKKKPANSSDGSDSSEKKLSKKELALQQALGQITTTFGKGSIMWLGRSASSKNVPVVSTGSFSLDMALGVGGFPKGRVIEIYGPEASGKTTLALHVIAESQKQGGSCVFVDAEHAFDPALAQAIGVNTENLYLSQPDCGEQALSFVDSQIRRGSVDVVVVNNVAALVPKGEVDGEMGDTPMAMQARLMGQALRKLCHSLFLSQTILIFISQIRSKPSTFGGSEVVTCCGNAVKFYASVRLFVCRIGYVKKGEEVIGSRVQVKVVKNKLAPPFRIAQFELERGKGICKESEIIILGLKYKFMSQAASLYRFHGRSFYGKESLKTFLLESEDAREELITKLREKLLDAEMGKPQNRDETEGSLQEDVITPPNSRDEDAVTAVKVMKNNKHAPFRNVQFELKSGKGISKESEIIDLALKYKFITKAGSFFKYNGRNFHGKEALKTFLSKNEDVRKELITKLQEYIITPPDSTDEDAVTAAEA
uniref:RecA family profile 2 domain-containing protein n=1 Tax=Cucumis sativus TaxID=3659 RepID=A0A0A0LFR1_CUCSA